MVVPTTNTPAAAESSSSLLLSLFFQQKRRKRLLECLGCFVFGCCLGMTLDMVVVVQPTLQTISNNNNNNNNSYANQQLSTTASTKHGITSSYFGSPLKFVFVLGVEGTGHHLMGAIFEKSPTRTHLMEEVEIRGLGMLRQRLFNIKTLSPDGHGLWDSHCGGPSHDTATIVEKLIASHSMWNEQVIEWNKNNPTPVGKSKSKDYNNKATIFPINTVQTHGGYGEVSYPNFAQECRFLAYPNLDLWYDGVCNKAHVDCEHVYLYRDPAAMIQSTTINRSFNPSIFAAIHLYITMFHIIASQLLEETSTTTDDGHHHYHRRTLGCFGFYEFNDTSSWWDDVRDLGGWGSKVKYDTFMTKLYKAPKPVSDSLIPSEYDMYMKPLNEVHERVKRICQKNLKARRH